MTDFMDQMTEQQNFALGMTTGVAGSPVGIAIHNAIDSINRDDSPYRDRNLLVLELHHGLNPLIEGVKKDSQLIDLNKLFGTEHSPNEPSAGLIPGHKIEFAMKNDDKDHRKVTFDSKEIDEDGKLVGTRHTELTQYVLSFKFDTVVKDANGHPLETISSVGSGFLSTDVDSIVKASAGQFLRELHSNLDGSELSTRIK